MPILVCEYVATRFSLHNGSSRLWGYLLWPVAAISFTMLISSKKRHNNNNNVNILSNVNKHSSVKFIANSE